MVRGVWGKCVFLAVTIVVLLVACFHLFLTVTYTFPETIIQDKLSSVYQSYFLPFYAQDWEFFAPVAPDRYEDLLVRFKTSPHNQVYRGSIYEGVRSSVSEITPFVDVTKLANDTIYHRLIPGLQQRMVTDFYISFYNNMVDLNNAYGNEQETKKERHSGSSVRFSADDFFHNLTYALDDPHIDKNLKFRFLAAEKILCNTVRDQYSYAYSEDIKSASDMQVRIVQIPLQEIKNAHNLRHIAYTYFTLPWFPTRTNF